jgi:hypothetical protein
MQTFNKVACEPFPDKAVRVETKGDGEFKVATVANTKSTLVRLKVLMDARFTIGNSVSHVLLEKGSGVWVRADLYASDYGKTVFDLDGLKFILLPADRIEVAEVE